MLVALATEQGFPLWRAMGTILQGWALATQGQEEEGLRRLHQGLTAYRALGAEVQRTYWLTLLADAYRRAAQIDPGLVILGEALGVVDTTQECFYEAEIYRLQGELQLMQAVRAEEQGERCFCQALAIARRQEAKALELRAAMSLARLWQQQGKRAAAYDLLAPIYGWFAEGFETADLQEAKPCSRSWRHKPLVPTRATVTAGPLGLRPRGVCGRWQTARHSAGACRRPGAHPPDGR